MPYEHDGAAYEEDEQEAPRSNVFSWLNKYRDIITRNGDDDEYYEDAQDDASHNASAAHAAPNTPPVARVPQPHRHAGGSITPMRRPATVSQLRMERDQPVSVTVRRTVQSFEDVRRAVDGLREGTQQIVNIEQTPADVAERLIDFMNGATYALDGSVEKIGAQVYLFTPSSVTIDIEDKAKTATAKPFFDRE